MERTGLTLLNTLPIPYINEWFSTGIVGEFLSIGTNMTMGMISLYLCISIAMSYADRTGLYKEGLVLSSMVDFIAITGISPVEALQVGYFDGRGMLGGIIITLVTCHLYQGIDHLISRRKKGFVVSNILESFYSMIPVSICMMTTVSISTMFYSHYGMHIIQYMYSQSSRSFSVIFPSARAV